MKIAALMLAVLFSTPAARAYVFNFEEASVASYLNAAGGLPNIHSTAYADSSGSGNVPDKDVSYDYSGEIGFLFKTKRANILMGGEFLQTQTVSSNLNNPSGTSLASLTSTVYGIIGDFGLEFILRPRVTNHFLIGIEGCYANVNYNNNYAFTPAGTAKYSLADYTERGSGYGFGGKAYVGFEFLFTDNVTLSTSLGYRYLPIYSLNYDQDAKTINGNVSSGGAVQNNDGSNRQLDLGGPFFGLSLRFYFL